MGLLCSCAKWSHFSCQKIKRDQAIPETWMYRACERINEESTDLTNLKSEFTELRAKLRRAEELLRDLEVENRRLSQRPVGSEQKVLVIGDSMVRQIG